MNEHQIDMGLFSICLSKLYFHGSLFLKEPKLREGVGLGDPETESLDRKLVRHLVK